MKPEGKGKRVLPGHTESYSPAGVVLRAQHMNLVFTANSCGCANVSETDGFAYIGKWFKLCDEHRQPIVVTGLGAGPSYLDYEAVLTRTIEPAPRPKRRRNGKP